MNNTRCANLACACEVQLVGDYCMPTCKANDNNEPANVECRCGHTPCKEALKQEGAAVA